MRSGLFLALVMVCLASATSEACNRCVSGVRGGWRNSPYATNPLQYVPEWQPRPVVDPSFRPSDRPTAGMPRPSVPAPAAPARPKGPAAPFSDHGGLKGGAPRSVPAPAAPAPGVTYEPGLIRVGGHPLQVGRPVEFDSALDTIKKVFRPWDFSTEIVEANLRSVRENLKAVAPLVTKLEAKQALGDAEKRTLHAALWNLSHKAMDWFGPLLENKSRDARKDVLKSIEQKLAAAQNEKGIRPQDGAVLHFLRGFAKHALDVDGERQSHEGVLFAEARPFAMSVYQSWLWARDQQVTNPAPAVPATPQAPPSTTPPPSGAQPPPSGTQPPPSGTPPGTFRF